jgi:hypothetical protein
VGTFKEGGSRCLVCCLESSRISRRPLSVPLPSLPQCKQPKKVSVYSSHKFSQLRCERRMVQLGGVRGVSGKFDLGNPKAVPEFPAARGWILRSLCGRSVWGG